MKKIITAMNNPNINKELKKEKNVEILCKDIQYKEGILEILENKKLEINYIIIDEKLPGQIEIEKLIEKILEKNKKIKIIITIKKENKNKVNFSNINIIKIYYEKNINLEKIKNYNEDKNLYNNILKNKLINKKIENNNSKIINFFGERQVGKTLTIFNISNFLSNQKYKILIIEFNSENPCIKGIFKYKIKNNTKKIKSKKVLIKKFIKNKKYKIKYLNSKILDKFKIKINKNIDIIFYNKIINIKLIKKIEKNYDFIFIENYLNKNNLKNKEIINNSKENILIIEPNLLGIKNSKKIIEKNKLYKNNNLKIIINNYNKNSIDINIIKNIFNKNQIISKIAYEVEYEKIINSNFKNVHCISKKYNEQLKSIANSIM